MRRLSWAPKATWLIKQLYGGVPAHVLAEVLHVQVSDVRNRARKLGLCKPHRNAPQRWMASELQLLQEIYPDVPSQDVAALLARPLQSIYRMAKKLGVEKSEAFKASVYSGRVLRGKQDPRMVGSRFKKGLVPWNKGSHFVAGGRSAETRFKKGRPAHEARNYKPIGSLRYEPKDGYLQRKVTDDPKVFPAQRWVGVHRLVWQEQVGPIPEGHMVRFKAGKFTVVLEEITVDRLECISMAENLARNRWQNDPTLKALIPLKSQITRHANRIAREAKERSAP
ncbi:MAG: HNH endonuclease [Hylemonella sp.]|uniref:HNH endonuclease n=1 Tax=Hylemonella sp. TaxID=2066020 RepID=UPI00391C4C59